MTTHIDVPQLAHNIEAEQALLGAILINNQAYGMVSGLVGPEHFFEPIHREIYRLAGDLIVEGKTATPITLKPLLGDVTIADMPIGKYLVALAANSTTIINAPDYARHVFEFWQLRRIAEITSAIPVVGTTPSQAVADKWRELDALRAHSIASVDERDKVGAFALKVSEKVMAPQSAEIVPSTGFSDLDRFIGGGYRPGRLIVAAGRPGMGKSVFGIASARRVALKGYGVVYFSLEIDGEEVAARTIAASLAMTSAPIEYSKILARDLSDWQKQKVHEAAQNLGRLPMEIDATGGVSMFEIDARVRMCADAWARRQVKLGLVVIDYLGLVRPSDRYKGRKVDELGEIAWASKQLAKRFGCAVLLLSQLNRAVEGRDDKRPTMADLRDSGNIEEHADIVALLYRPAYYDERDLKVRDGDPDAVAAADARRNDLEVGLGKNRLGPTIAIKLHADVARCCVDNQAR